MNSIRNHIYFMICILFIVISINLSYAINTKGIVIDLSPSGDAYITVTIEVHDAPTLVELRALAKPIIAKVLLNEELVPMEYNETYITAFADENGTLKVEYLTQELTVKEGALWMLDLTIDSTAKILLPIDAIPLKTTPDPSTLYKEGDRIILEFHPGKIHIEYYIVPEFTTTQTIGPPTTMSTSPTMITITSPSYARVFPGIWVWVIIIILILISAVSIVMIMKFRRNREIVQILDERDKKILKEISKVSRITAQELMERTGIPKSPLYRRLKKLEEAGLIRSRKDLRTGQTYYEKT